MVVGKVSNSQDSNARNYNYYLREDGAFVIENYNRSIKMPSFLPGIAGKYGIPIWVFYVNRGQCISSFGIDGKDGAILEFQPANKAFQLTPLTGFRTFLKIDGKFYEPFKFLRDGEEKKVKQEMVITSYDLSIREVNKNKNLEINVNYFTIPNESVGALVRVVRIKNIGKKKCSIEMLDGLPKFVSYGLKNFLLKDLSNLTEAWVDVENINEKAPFYKLKVAVADKPQVEVLKDGNFFISKIDGKTSLLPIVVDPTIVFGDVESLVFPYAFEKKSDFSIPKNQKSKNIFPTAFSYMKRDLNPSEEVVVVSCAGNARDFSYMENFISKFKKTNYIKSKQKENKVIIESIQDNVFTVSADKKFDYHCRQCFLDNILRGGMPYSIKTKKNPVIFHIYSRRHGDLERDYNWFQLLPTYFSQGNGSYRDVNQNRRNDVFFNPDVDESTIRTFMNLIQLDGYNPLSIKGSYFWIDDVDEAKKLAKKYVSSKADELSEYLTKKFTPGGLLIFIEEKEIKLKVSREDFLSIVLEKSQRMEDSDHGEGFWTDHWTYNLDLVESYFSIYPERIKTLFFEKRDFSFFDNYARVLPRKEKCVLTEQGVRQFNSVYVDNERKQQILERHTNPFAVRTDYGKGPVYKTTLFVKFLTLVINKAATLDPFGVGIEMESDKPNWYDALNGLPGLFGSSISETYELKRLALMLKDIIKREGISSGEIVVLPKELAGFFNKIRHILKEDLSDYDYWDRSHTAKEDYREKIINGISGVEVDFKMSEIIDFLDSLIAKLDKGLKKAVNKDYGIPNTYFVNEVVEYEKLEEEDGTGNHVWPKAFKQRPLPLFLEGIVHMIRCENDAALVKNVHKNVKKSPLFDKKLKMFKVNASLAKETYDIGRTKIFPPGWLENESVWIHMEYKYILELLKKGLYDEFFEEAKNVLIYNLDPFMYGRSILENSSFIISSAYYDESLHGKGCFARLSGSTAEFVHMWVLITSGKQPFFLNDNRELCFSLSPAIPSEFFTKEKQKANIYDAEGNISEIEIPKNSFAFKFLGEIVVIYVNPKRFNTWEEGVDIVKLEIFGKDGEKVVIDGNVVKGDLCLDIRERRVEKIVAYIDKK